MSRRKITFELPDSLYLTFKLACQARGETVSAALRALVIQYIHESSGKNLEPLTEKHINDFLQSLDKD